MTSELSLTMRAIVSGIAIDDRYGRQVALGRLKAILPPSKELVAGSVEYARGPFALGRLEGQVRFTASASASAVAVLNADALRAELAGLSISEANDLLSARPELSTADPPVLKVYPKGLEKMPILTIQIDLRLKEQT